MPTVKAPLFSDIYQNVHGVELNDQSATLYDGYRDENGFIVKRPGLRKLVNFETTNENAFPDTTVPIDGLFWWPQKRYVIAVSGGRTYKLIWDGSALNITDLTGTLLQSGIRPSFITDGAYVFIANGGKINYTNGTDVTAEISDGDAPITVSALAFVDGYVLANTVDSNRIQFSNINSPLAWNALDFFSIEGNPDFVTAIKEYNRELYFLGPVTTETWENDGSTPFSRIPGGMIESGTIAPQSIIRDEMALYWLDANKNFVAFNGRSVSRISIPFDRTIQAMSEVSDCMADKVIIDGRPFFIFHFPREKRTLVLNYDQKSWSEWGHWNTNRGDYDRWLGNCYCFCPDWGLHLVGSRAHPVVFKLDPDYYADYPLDESHDDGGDLPTDVIRLCRRTGHIDFGTSKQKRLEELRFRARRGQINNPDVEDTGERNARNE